MRLRKYQLEGISPILMHNGQLADPLNKWTKLLREISKKRNKTDDDLEEMSRREWFGGLYHNEEIGIHATEAMLERMLRDAAAMSKRGKDVNRGLMVLDPAPLKVAGAKTRTEEDLTAMWNSGKFLLRSTVAVGKQRVIRSRPRIANWSLEFVVQYDETVLDAADIDQFADTAGRLIGIGDWRPKYGRFRVTGKQEVS